jgi:beta-lactamase class D
VLDGTGFVGTVLVYDLRRDRYQAVHAERATRRLIPASTFKIVNALTALDAKVVAGPNTVIPWDRVVRERQELNRDLDLRTAFRLSAVPHFQRLAREIGAARMQRAVRAVGYGNGDIGGGIDHFWLDGALRISPLEQVGVLVRLYRDELPYSRGAMATVREIMEIERTPRYTIRAKTGWATGQPGEVGWWVGWVERGPDAYFFATGLESPTSDSTFAPSRQRVTRAALTSLGLIDAAAGR